MSSKRDVYNIVWTPDAELSFSVILNWIIDKWGLITAQKFDFKVEDSLEALRINPFIGKISEQTGWRKLVIHKNSSIIYRVVEDKVELMFFVDNRMNHLF